jgi:hypothetical protein
MFLKKWAILKNLFEGENNLLIVPEEIKIQIDEAIKKGVSKEDFILWTGENQKC